MGVQTMFLPQLIISMILFLVLFFGIGFLLNMVLRTTWMMAIIYPIIVILIIDKVSVIEYITAPAASFSALGAAFVGLQIADMLILTCGLAGAVISGIVIKMLRVRGYQMF